MTPTWYTATTAAGEYIEGNRDLRELLRVIREELDPDGDVVVTCNGLVVAVVCEGQEFIIPGRAWQCLDCGAPVAHGMTRCNLCVAERQGKAPGRDGAVNGDTPHGCEFCAGGKIGCAVCQGRAST